MSATIIPHPQRPSDTNWRILAGFQTGSHELQSAHRLFLIEKVIPRLRNQGDWVFLGGLASRRGSEERNLELSRMRANSVKSFLMTQGVPRQKITGVRGAGEIWSAGGVNDNSPNWRGVEVIVAPNSIPPAGRLVIEIGEARIIPDIEVEIGDAVIENPSFPDLPIYFPTTWRFVTSGGLEITGGPGVQIGGMGGAFYVENTTTGNQLTLPYGALGVGGGLGAPFSLDGSHPVMPGGGIGCIYGRGRRYLTPADFTGFCLIGNIQGAAIGGVCATAVYFGLPAPIPDTAHRLAKCAGMLWSMNVGIQAGVGVMSYLGYISEAA